MKSRRNDPCPCGSGKKYKHCCLDKDSVPAGAEFLWHKLKQLNEGLIARLLDTAIDTFGKEAIYEAWDEFMLWEEDAPGFDPESPHVQVFWPWFYHHWLPDRHDSEVRPDSPDVNRLRTQARHGSPRPNEGFLPTPPLPPQRERARDKGSPPGRGSEGEGMKLTVTRMYLKKHGDRLDPLARRYLEACHEAPFSFHDVVACEPGRGFVLRDIVSGEERHVIERGGSKHAQAGDILFAQVVVLDELAQLEGCAPLLMPPANKAPILALRKKIASSKQPITSALLRQYDLEMFGVYHALIEPLLNPPQPKFTNTDGDPLLFHRLIYNIDSPQMVFDALKALALDATDAELLAGAERDARGRLRKVEFSWLRRGNKQHKDWNNTILGNIRIDAGTLTVEVNSEKRANKFKTQAKKLLGPNARYRTTVIESPEAMLARGAPAMTQQQRAEQEALESDPDVQAEMAKFLEAHYDHWLNDRIPALGNKTPRQAVKTPEGRELVEALLVQFERDMREQKMPGSETLIERLREHLKM
jgi:hypothetical protein